MNEEKSLNIYQKLANIRKRVEVVQKNKEGFNYRYVSDDELLARLSGAMENYGVSLQPSIVPGTMHVEPYNYVRTKWNKQTKAMVDEQVSEVLVSAEMLFRWINNDDPTEVVEVPWAMVGQQADASQSMGSALTYAYRYFLLKYFGVATPEDDPDNWRSKQKSAELAEDRSIAASIISTIDDAIKSHLRTNPGDKEAVKKFAAKYAKDGNYFAITESALAAKMLEEFKNTFESKKGAK